MNFKKLLVILVPLAALFVGWLYYTRLDRTDPIAVANAFTKALKAGDIAAASDLFLPEKVGAWRTTTSEYLDKLKSASVKAFYDNIPGTPGYTSSNPKAPAGTMSLQSSDKNYNLEMAQVTGKWYVSKAPI